MCLFDNILFNVTHVFVALTVSGCLPNNTYLLCYNKDVRKYKQNGAPDLRFN